MNPSSNAVTTTPPEDVAALFGLPPPASSQSTPEAADAAEAEAAALAAELASAIESGGLAADAPDSRTDLRVEVSWPARMQLPNGRVIEVKVRNVSQGGVGLISDEDIPGHTVVNFEMDVPPLGEGRQITAKGTIKTTYTVVHGSETLCGGTWVHAPAAGRDLVNLWISRLRP